jgi:hypothetical protein
MIYLLLVGEKQVAHHIMALLPFSKASISSLVQGPASTHVCWVINLVMVPKKEELFDEYSQKFLYFPSQNLGVFENIQHFLKIV